MKLYKLLLVALVLLVSLVVAQPSWADRPKITENPDYIELTETLDQLSKARDTQDFPEGVTAEQAQQKITELQYQKYILETGQGTGGQCRNETGKTIAIYGPKSKKSDSPYDNSLYLLADGQQTDEDWNCQGMYLPSDVKVAGLDLDSAAAIKSVSGTQLVVKSNPDTGALELNLPPAKVFKAGEAKWFIPDLSQDALALQIPNAPVGD